jgi:hypothetical protein
MLRHLNFPFVRQLDSEKGGTVSEVTYKKSTCKKETKINSPEAQVTNMS